MDICRQQIITACGQFGVEISEQQMQMLEKYAELLIEWNKKINLTAITEPREIGIKHFLDCLLFLKHCKIPKGAKVIDVGTGAGFPGIVLKIARPDIKLTLLDSLNKRLVFLEEVCNTLGIDARTVHLRAEQGGMDKLYREQFDIATARAVARLNVLCEYCLPFVKKGGLFVAMKGPAGTQELEESRKALKILGGGQPVLATEKLTADEERSFITIKKISQTPPKYPRISAKISKMPL